MKITIRNEEPSNTMELELRHTSEGVDLVGYDSTGEMWYIAELTGAGIRLYNSVKAPDWPTDEWGRTRLRDADDNPISIRPDDDDDIPF